MCPQCKCVGSPRVTNTYRHAKVEHPSRASSTANNSLTLMGFEGSFIKDKSTQGCIYKKKSPKVEKTFTQNLCHMQNMCIRFGSLLLQWRSYIQALSLAFELEIRGVLSYRDKIYVKSSFLRVKLHRVVTQSELNAHIFLDTMWLTLPKDVISPISPVNQLPQIHLEIITENMILITQLFLSVTDFQLRLLVRPWANWREV